MLQYVGDRARIQWGKEKGKSQLDRTIDRYGNANG